MCAWISTFDLYIDFYWAIRWWRARKRVLYRIYCFDWFNIYQQLGFMWLKPFPSEHQTRKWYMGKGGGCARITHSVPVPCCWAWPLISGCRCVFVGKAKHDHRPECERLCSVIGTESIDWNKIYFLFIFHSMLSRSKCYMCEALARRWFSLLNHCAHICRGFFFQLDTILWFILALDV